MQPQFITKPAFTLVGLRIQTKPKDPEISQLWDQFVPRIAEIEHISEPYVSYGMMDNLDIAQGKLDYMAGNSVSRVENLPTGMTRWEIPANTYAVFAATLSTIPQTFDYIYGTWLPSSDYQPALAPYFERYGETFSMENPALSIYIPVTPKG